MSGIYEELPDEPKYWVGLNELTRSELDRLWEGWLSIREVLWKASEGIHAAGADEYRELLDLLQFIDAKHQLGWFKDDENIYLREGNGNGERE